jgi:hypothetical protein
MQDDSPAALESLEAAVTALPSFQDTRRYWIAAGRIAYRLGHDNHHATYFRAHQLMHHGRYDDSKSVLQTLADEPGISRVVGDLMAEILSRKAVDAVCDNNPSGAEVVWKETFSYASWRDVNWIGTGFAMAMASPHPADRIDRMMLPRVDQIGDRLVRSDIISLVGDTYFRDGQFDRARDMYQRSMKVFSLPKYVNVHAQEGLLGM